MVEEVVPTDEDLIPGPSIEAAGAPGFARNAAVMSVGTALSRVTGMLRVSATVAALGLTPLATTYVAANTTPNIVYELVLGGILTSVFVPVFVDWAQTHGREESWHVAERTLTLALVVLSAIALAGGILAPWIMRLYLVASDHAGKQAEIQLGAFFLRWFMPQIVFYGIGAVATGVLNANGRFGTPMFAPILNNLSVIATMLAFVAMRGGLPPSVEDLTSAQKMLLAAGTTFGVFAMTAALWPALRGIGFRWRLRFDWRHPAVMRLGHLAKWVVVYVAANQLAYLLIIVLNNRADPERGYAAYATAFIFFQLPHAIFAVSVFTALLPAMAERWTAGRPQAVRALWSRGMRAMAVILIPATLGYLVLAGPIVRLLAEYGAAGEADRELLARTLQAFAIGLPFFSAFQLLTRTFYAMQDARTPALVNVAAAVVNIGADVLYVFAFGWGVGGLALGHATSYVVGSALLAVMLRARLHGIDGRRIASTIGRVVPAAALCAAAALGVATLVGGTIGTAGAIPRLVQVLSAVTAGLLVFFVCAFIFRLEEVDDVRRGLLRRFGG